MTLCVAGMHVSNESKKQLVIAAFDRKVTTFSGSHSWGRAWKMQSINKQWWGLMAGTISEMTAILDAVKSGTKKVSIENFRDFARACVKPYKEERERLIESEILSQYDIASYAEYRSLKTSDRDFFDAINQEIQRFDDNLNLLMCGFDKNKEAHLFVVSGSGKIQYCDLMGFAAIGSGAWAATTSLDHHPYDKWNPLGECVYAVLAAKFNAESAEGVGTETVIFVLDPSAPRQKQASIWPKDVEEVKEKWKALPRIPEGVAAGLGAEFQKFLLLEEGRKRSQRIKRLIARKRGDQQ